MKTDYEFGYQDGKAGAYDKWYRYNREDEGKEYDLGIKASIMNGYEIKVFIEAHEVSPRANVSLIGLINE